MSDIPRVFISYTGEDLSAHADVVAAVLRKLQVLAIDHRDFGAVGTPSVQWCYEQIDACDLLVVLVAHRYGWVPPADEGGDGETSVTWLEVRHARRRRKTVLPYLIERGARWSTDHIEALAKPSVLPRLDAFKRDLSKAVAGFFTDPQSLDGPVSRNVRDALDALRRQPAPAAPAVQPTAGASVLPWIYSRDEPPSVVERLTGAHPKRVLCLDSANVEVAIALSWLERLERLLQARYGEPDFTLSDYFDLIAGSGFGSIVAAELASGRRVADIMTFFREHIGGVFKQQRRLLPWNPLYSPARFERTLAERFGETTFARGPWRTGVMLVGARVERGVPCHFANHPSEIEKHERQPLAKVLLGCNSPLSYYPPVLVAAPDGLEMALADAEIVGAGNPSLYVLLLIAGEEFRWRLGRHQLTMFSIGGVHRQQVRDAKEVAESNLFTQIPMLINAMLGGTAFSARLLLRALAGDPEAPLSFHRFEGDPATALPAHADLLRQLSDMNWQQRVERWADLESIGRDLAERGLTASVLSPAFDVRLVPDAADG